MRANLNSRLDKIEGAHPENNRKPFRMTVEFINPDGSVASTMVVGGGPDESESAVDATEVVETL